MSIAEKRIPQDGRIQINVMGKDLDLRVSSIPTNHGESIVMRILDKGSIALGLPQLGFFADDQQVFERLIGLSDGIILVTGPTGSGKTTTLYACLIILFLRVHSTTQTFNTNAHSPLRTHARKPYPYEHLRRTEPADLEVHEVTTGVETHARKPYPYADGLLRRLP